MISALFGLAGASASARPTSWRGSAPARSAPSDLCLRPPDRGDRDTIWLFASGQVLVWSPLGVAIAVAHGVSVAVMCVLLYIGIARGPIAVVVPIVAAHPALVLAVNVFMGVRPSAIQWAAMIIVIAGGVVIARSALAGGRTDAAEANRTTLLIAFSACVAYVAIVLTGAGRDTADRRVSDHVDRALAGLVLLGGVLIVQQARLTFPREWLPFVSLQGGLELVGVSDLPGRGEQRRTYVTMVLASAFSVVTVLLARFIVHEPISKMQWVAIALIAIGAAVLSVS